jgi:hypothetical protein
MKVIYCNLLSTRAKSAIAHNMSKICPHARTVPNPFRTHFRTHITHAEVRHYAHVCHNPMFDYDYDYDCDNDKKQDTKSVLKSTGENLGNTDC